MKPTETSVAITPMRIVELGKYFPPHYFGGVELMTQLSAKALATEHAVTVICHNTTARSIEEQRDGYRIVRCATQTVKFSQPISLAMGAELRKASPDLIHLHAPNFWAALMVELYCPRVPIMVTHYADVEGRAALKKVVLPIYHRVIERSECVIVNSVKNVSCSVDLTSKIERVAEIPFGLDGKKYLLAPSDLAAALESKQRLFGAAPVVGFIGRFVWYKGLAILLEAISSLPGVCLILVGDGPLKDRVVEQARTRGIADRVHFAGTTSHAQKLKLFGMMDILVLPSTHVTESFGIVQIEAQLCGLPVIRTSLPSGVSDITIAGETGLVIPPANAPALAKAIALLASNESLRTEYGQRGRERALQHFSETQYMFMLRNEVNRVLSKTCANFSARQSSATSERDQLSAPTSA